MSRLAMKVVREKCFIGSIFEQIFRFARFTQQLVTGCRYLVRQHRRVNIDTSCTLKLETPIRLCVLDIEFRRPGRIPRIVVACDDPVTTATTTTTIGNSNRRFIAVGAVVKFTLRGEWRSCDYRIDLRRVPR